MRKPQIAIFSPFAIICIGFIVAYALYPLMSEWVFVPLALIYWAVTFAVSYRTLGKEEFVKLFGKPAGKPLWPVLCFVVGLIPLSILLMNLDLLRLSVTTVLWVAFAIINPFCEEIFWRGFLLTHLPFPKKISVVYSTALFVASHPFMWGVFSIANRSWMTWVSLSIMGIVWSITYLKTESLRWCIISHFMVDIFNLSVFVFLNLYIPPV